MASRLAALPATALRRGAGGEGAPSSMSARDLGSPTYFPQFPCAKVSVTPDGEERYIDGEVRF